VARLAGVPEPIILRAKEILKNLEAAELTADHKPALARTLSRKEAARQEAAASQLTLFDSSLHKDVLELLRAVDLNSITPLEALNKLSEIKKKVS
jgi:DNA mismatch repair protein MutS